LACSPRVEVAGRLVGKDQIGIGDEGSGDGDSLLLSTGELPRQVIEARTEPQVRQQLLRALHFLVIRPDLPPRTDFDAISRLVASNAIMNMELRGDTLTVTKRSGERLRLEGITTDQYRRLQPIEFRRLVAISPSNNLWSLATELAAIASSIVPALVGAALALVAQTILRRRRMRPAAG